MDCNGAEISEEKVIEAVRYAHSRQMCLNQLSNLLVMEGGVDLDTLARVIREFRDGTGCAEKEAPAMSVTVPEYDPFGTSAPNAPMNDSWSELKKTG
ncbi:MAG: hypothetical protein GKR97_14620 [Rhizobiaceae bacterium]|nr:hypothetical protein [Rhizobiaceae bacterium]